MTLHRVRFVLSNRLREQLALELMYLVGYHHLHDKPPWKLDELIGHLGLPDEPISRILRVLVETGYLIEVQEEDALLYLPQHDLETIQVADLLDAVRSAGESRLLSVSQMTSDDAVNQLMATIGRSMHDGLQQCTLRDLVGPLNETLETAAPADEPDYSSNPSAV
jgi:membrane protein